MRIAKLQDIDRLYRVIGFLGFIGALNGVVVNSLIGLLASCFFWWAGRRLVEVQWQYAEGGGYVIDDETGNVVGQTTEECYINQKDLPKKFEIVRYTGETVFDADLLVVNLVHGGFIIPLHIQVLCAPGVSPDAIRRYYRHSTRGEQTSVEYVEWAFQEFRDSQHPTTGVFGHHHSLRIGFPDWIEGMFKPRLQEFLIEACKDVGIEVKGVVVTPRERQRSIIMPQRRGDYAAGIS